MLHVINQLSGRAGAEVSLRDLVLASHGRGIDHSIVTLSRSTNVLDGFEQAGVRVFPGGDGLSRIDRVRHVRDAIHRVRPTLVHTSLFEADLAGRVAAYACGSPVLTSIVNTPYGPEAREAETVGPVRLRAVKSVDSAGSRHLTTAFHAISRAAAEHATRYLGIQPERIRIVPRGRSARALGVATPERRQFVRDREGWGDGPVVVNVARQEPQKGQIHLLEAWQDVTRDHPEATLVVVGREGRSSDLLKRFVEENGLAGAVIFTGTRRDVPDLVAASDVFAFPSLYEGLGGAALEAAGLGVPVVASDLPALREVLGDKHPWMVPPGSARPLAAAIVSALEDRERAARVGAAQRRRFLERFELQVAIDGMVTLYHDLARLIDAQAGSSVVHRIPRLTSWE